MNSGPQESRNMLPIPGEGPNPPLPDEMIEQIEHALEPDLKNISKDQKGRIVSRVVTTIAMFQGPLPPPAMLEQYELVLPGAADRIITMAERELEAQIEDRKRSRSNEHSQAILGTLGGITAVLTLPAFAAYIAALGYPIVAVGLAGVTLSTIVAAFLYDRNVIRKDSRRDNQSSPLKKSSKRR